MIRAVSHDAHSCGVSASAAWTIAALPMIGGLLVAATYPSWSLFIWILREDHLVEWAQAWPPS